MQRPRPAVVIDTETGSPVDLRPGMAETIVWSAGLIELTIETPSDDAPRLARIVVDGAPLDLPCGLPLVDVLTVSGGHLPANDRLVHTTEGAALRATSYRMGTDGRGDSLLELTMSGAGGLVVRRRFTVPEGLAVMHLETEVSNAGGTPVVLRSVTSFSTYLGAAQVGGWRLHHAESDWLGEGRWQSGPLAGSRLVPLREDLTGHDPRGSRRFVSTGTWSTGRYLPTGIAASAEQGVAWAWQIEHNGPWRWEVGEDTAGPWLALSGPTDDDHQWVLPLAPGERFDAVPVTVALAVDADSAIGELTRYRRVVRRPHPDNTAMPVIFNDYMNTLNGDPTTERLLPLIDAAAAVGAEIFCVDAGWYADGYWWDSVGEWLPSERRFPGGLGEVLDRIRERGMVPGLWLEPEVVGVRSPVGDRLPHAAFLQRHGQRIVEHERYHLDLRHPAARAHLDGVIDRLVDGFGVGYFKLDYNVDPGAGTDFDAPSAGHGLLEHNRAHQTWLDGVLDRHPGLVLENCGSGAMRADPAMLARLQLQSTSDQQDFRRYPPIAASAPASMLPEQAASWAYPQPEMGEEEVAFCLVTGLLGRFFLSGYLNRMDDARLGLVRSAVEAAHEVKPVIASGLPCWPLGRPGWDDEHVALGLRTDDQVLLAVWDRTGTSGPIDLSLPDLAGSAVQVSTVFPTSLQPWSTAWDRGSGVLRVHNPSGSLGARVLRITASLPGA